MKNLDDLAYDIEKRKALYNISLRRESKSKASFEYMGELLKTNNVVTYASNKNCIDIIKEFKNILDMDVTLTKISSHIFDIKICK
jgi:hypothetical protein